MAHEDLNSITGDVHGNAVQARDIHGNVYFNGTPPACLPAAADLARWSEVCRVEARALLNELGR